MAVTLEYQAWDSASYNWLDNSTSTAAPQQINDKLDAWVATVNANASNSTRQLTVHKDPSSSTSANYVGWVIQAGGGASGSGFYFLVYTNGTQSIYREFSQGWSDSGSNGGYGSKSGNSYADSSASFHTSAVTGEFAVATETTNGEEFFCLGWRTDNNNQYSDFILIFKDENGEWAAYMADSGANFGCFYMPTHTAPKVHFFCETVNYASNVYTNYLAPLMLNARNSDTTYDPGAGQSFTGAVRAASSALLVAGSTSSWGFGKWGDVADGSKVVCMSYNGLYVKV